MTTVFGAVVQRKPVAAPTVNPLIQPASTVVVVKKSYTSPARVKITLKVSSHFGRAGTLSRTVTPTSGKIAIFTTATGTTEIDFVNNTNTTFSAAQLNAGVPVFAEASQASTNLDDFQLTLTLAPGSTPVGLPATATFTAVALQLDIIGLGGPPPIFPLPQPPDPPPAPGTATDKWFAGQVLNVQDPDNKQDRVEIKVDAVSPAAFAGDLVLRNVKINKKDKITGLDTKVRLFDSRTPGPLQNPPVAETPKANPLVFNAGTTVPIGTSFFAEGHTASASARDTGFQLGIDGVENDGDRVAMTAVVAPLLSVDSPLVVVKKPHTTPKRRIITLKTSAPSTLTGTLTKAGAGPIKIFTTAAGATEVTFDGTDNVFSGALLGSAAGVTLFAESTSASTAAEDFELTLTLSGGSLPLAQPVTIKLTAVEITLDVAQTKTSAKVTPPLLSSTDKIKPVVVVIKQDAAFSHERALLVIRPAKPSVSLTFRLEAFNASVQAFADEVAAGGQVPRPNPDTVISAIVPATGDQLFIEGAAVSGAFFDTGFRLGIDGLENDADHVVVTVLPDPSLPGLFAVGEHEYTRAANLAIPAITETLSDLTVADVGPPAAQPNGAFNAKIHALVRYPATAAGADTPVSGVLPKYPLVVIAHGNHNVLDALGAPVESFRGLEYLARHLASYGYIAISVDLDSMNTAPFGSVDPGIVQRGLVVLEHIAFWNVLNAGDPIFAGKFDDSQIALIGHSRGGEAVVSAQKTNINDARGLNIKAVISISQTDFLGIVHSTTPYLVIYGSADGDVSIGWPFRLYDRASLFKALMFVYGANHNRFSTSPDWLANLDLDPVVDGRIISEADHLNVAKGYSLGFLQLILRNVGDHVFLFKNNLKPSAVSGGVEIHNQVQDKPPRLTVDDFEQGAFAPAVAHGAQLAGRATTNTLGLAVTQAGLVVPEAPVTNPATNKLTNALTEGSLRHRDLDFFWNDTFGEVLAWDVAGGTYTQALGTKDVSSFDVLSFRATQRFGVARNPAPPALSPDFSITLKDAAGHAAEVKVSTITPLPVPYKRVDVLALTKSALTTIRIPLKAFTTVNGSLDLKTLATVIFHFVPTAKGEIAIDDLEFSN